MSFAKVYRFNLSGESLALEPINPAQTLPIGLLVSYEDMANHRKIAMVSGPMRENCSQPALFEDGHQSQVHASDLGTCGWRRIEPEKILSEAEQAEFIAQAEKQAAADKIAVQAQDAAEQTARTQERARIIAAHPGLEQASKSKRSSHALGAFNLRRLLAQHFPGVAFSVRSDTFSGGDSIDISWVDGPTTAEVEKFSRQFQEGSFDGMQDLYEYSQAVWPDVFGGAKYVHTHRSISSAVHVQTAAEMGFTVTCDARENLTGIDEEMKQAVYRLARERSYFVAPSAPAPSTEPAAASASGATMAPNVAKAGIEVRFPVKPAESVLTALKTAGFRWSRFGACWYHRDTPENRAAAKSIIDQIR